LYKVEIRDNFMSVQAPDQFSSQQMSELEERFARISIHETASLPLPEQVLEQEVAQPTQVETRLALSQLSQFVYVTAKERVCFRNLGFAAHLKKVVEIARSLMDRGVKLYHFGGSLPSTAVLPEFDARTP
jgi:hypothetical protein